MIDGQRGAGLDGDVAVLVIASVSSALPVLATSIVPSLVSVPFSITALPIRLSVPTSVTLSCRRRR